ncbi:MAG: protein-L-isoaspartate(D-aspartate) O-methyltransferase [Anaerolineae bacterium]
MRISKPGALPGWVVGLALAIAGCGLSEPPTPAAVPTVDTAPPAEEDPLAALREQMVGQQIEARGVTDERVLAALREVPRHEFVPAEFRGQSYADRPLPIGLGQTISQPYIVGLMTELLDLGPGEKVLEVGTGSGYQAAVLAELTDLVYTIEIIPELGSAAAERLIRLGYGNIRTEIGDGYFGWRDRAPFDAIIVTAAPDHVPPPLMEQLAEGGRLVVPVGPLGAFQTLWLITKTDGELRYRNMGGVRFVPLTGGPPSPNN